MAFFKKWVDDSNAPCGKLLQNGRLPTLETLRACHGRLPMDFWHHKQLSHFFATQGQFISATSQLTPSELLFAMEEPTPHVISELYQLLGSAASKTKSVYIREWERDLGREFSEVQLAPLYHLTHSSFTESRTQETNYKILTRWYRVPAALS